MSIDVQEGKKLRKSDLVSAGVFLVLGLALVSAFVYRGVEEVKHHKEKIEAKQQVQNKITTNVINYQNQR